MVGMHVMLYWVRKMLSGDFQSGLSTSTVWASAVEEPKTWLMAGWASTQSGHQGGLPELKKMRYCGVEPVSDAEGMEVDEVNVMMRRSDRGVGGEEEGEERKEIPKCSEELRPKKGARFGTRRCWLHAEGRRVECGSASSFLPQLSVRWRFERSTDPLAHLTTTTTTTSACFTATIRALLYSTFRAAVTHSSAAVASSCFLPPLFTRTMTTRTSLAKRDANTLASSDHTSTDHTSVKRARTDKDEFDTDDVDDDALLAAALEAESAASSQPAPSSSQPVPSTSEATKSSPPASPSKTTATATPRTSMRQTTLVTPSKAAPITTPAQPRLQPPADDSDPLWLERQTMSPAWFDILRPEMAKPYFATLKSFLAAQDRAGKTTYPPRELIYSWSRLVPSPRHVRVVVVGQDPYHGPDQACGLSFSVPKGVRTPPSLKNIYKELAAEYPSFHAPNHGCLEGWARQGVLLLNACLTVSAGAAASHHGQGWEGLTKHILKRIADEAAKSPAAKAASANAVATSTIATMFAKAQSNPKPETKPVQPKDGERDGEEQCKGVVFLVWGAPAAKTLAEAGVTDKSPNVLILKSAHPSPLSAHRGFLGNGHFKRANDWLAQRYGPDGTINWSDL